MEERAWALYDYVKKEIVSDWYELSRRMANTDRLYMIEKNTQRVKKHIIDTALFAYMLAIKLRPKFRYSKNFKPESTKELMKRIETRAEIKIELVRKAVEELGELVEKLGYTKVEKTAFDVTEAVRDMG